MNKSTIEMNVSSLVLFNIQRLFVLLLVAAGLGFASSDAVAQKKYPELQGEFFSDDANLVDLNTRRQISRDMRNTLQDSKIHVVLAVINQMSDYPQLDQDMKKFTEAVAEHWELGEAKSKLGILVMFSIKDRKFFVAKTKEMSTRLTDEIKQGMMGLPVKALKQNNVSLAMKRAANVLVEMVPSFDSKNGAQNIVGAKGAPAPKTNQRPTTNQNPTTNRRPVTQNSKPPTRVIRQERANNGGGGGGMGALVCVGVAVLLVVLSLAGVGMAASRGFGGGGGYYGGGGGYYGGGGGGFFSGMLTGSLLGGMFGGSNHGWGSGYHHEEHHHHYDGGGGYDGGGYDGGGYDGGGYDGGGFDGGGFDYGADTFGGGDFDGGSMGEW